MDVQPQQAININDINVPPPPFPNKVPKGIDNNITFELAKKGLTQAQIARVQGCDRSNIARVLQRYEVEQQDVEDFKSHRADIFAGLQQRLLQSITPEDVKRMPGGSRVLAVAQLYDKERLERGLSTQNIDTHATQVNINQLSSELDKIRKRRLALQGERNEV